MSSKTNVINSQQEKTPSMSTDLDASSAPSRKKQSGATAAISSKTSSSESETKVHPPMASDKRTTTKRPLATVDASAKLKPNNHRPPPPLHKPPAPGPGVSAMGQLSEKVHNSFKIKHIFLTDSSSSPDRLIIIHIQFFWPISNA